jgi:NAD(P)-dependent dehydrogenase (short-subunit alcohol dehydrogenase family)
MGVGCQALLSKTKNQISKIIARSGETDMLLKDECIIVTGASGNLGSVVARVLAGRGAQVVCVDRVERKFDAVEHGSNPDRLLWVSGHNVADKAAMDDVVAQTIARFGKITGLVNTVGGFATGRVADDALDHWDLMMMLNAKVAVVTSAAVLPHMMTAGHGRIVHIAAQPGLKATAGQAAYAASKAAVIRIMESIAAEHRADRITANCVMPGTIDTPINRAAMPNAKPDIWIQPKSIADLIAFLMSPEAALVTGAAIPATGLM